MLPPALLPAPVFNSLTGAYLLLTPDAVIEAVSDDYLAATLAVREQLMGRTIFDAFPDNPATPETHATDNLRASLAQVLATGQPHEMAPQHHDVPDPVHPGRFVERHWRCTNRPVLGADGRVTHVLHFAVDVTAQHQAEHSLHEAQAAEQAARAEAEAQRQRLYTILERFPAVVARYRGPEHVFDLVSHRFQEGFPTRTIKGRPVREALPELEGQGYFDILDGVYRTGEPFFGTELETWVDPTGTGALELQYYNVCFQATRDAEDRIDGILNFAYDVTEQVLARQQVQQLNQELEARVDERTRAALALQADLLAAAQQQADQRALLYQVFEQTPAVVALLRAPGHRYEYVNPAYQAFFPGRQLVGRDVAEAVPELQAQGFVALLDRVYQTGETYLGQELPFAPAPAPGQAPRTVYFNFTFQAYREAGEIAGVSIFAYDVTEQVLARQEREAQRQELEQLFMQAPAPIVILDGPDLVYQLVNPAYQRIFPGRELLGKPLMEALPELVGTPIPDMLGRVYQTGEPLTVNELPLQMARHEGAAPEEIYWTFTYQARRDPHGLVDGVRVFAHDVTEPVRARQRAEESRAELKHFRFMADQARDPFILMRADGSFAYLNQRALEAWGYSPEELEHLRVPDLDPIYQQDDFNRLFARAQHDTIPLFETLHRRKDGYVYPVEISAAGLRLDGQPHLLVVARDVTEQKRYVAALKESEARFRTMADAAPNMVWAVHPDSSIRYVNRAFLDFVGLETEQQYTATGWLPYLHPDELERTQQALTHAMAGRLPYHLEHRMRRHDGEYRWLLAQGAPSYLAGGELYGYVGSAIDITDLKHVNEQLTRTNADLDNFIYTASHDLKAPIANIEGLLYVLREELPADVVQGELVAPTLTRMLDSVERFQRTIDHLTEVSKLQQAHAPDLTAVDLAAVVEDVRLDLAPLLQETNAELRVRVADFPPVRFAEKNLRSVVYNLLSNALKYRHPDRRPHVDVRAHLRPGHTVLEVHDNGLGLTEAQQAQLFGMFQRFHDHVEGSGIGLFMVKRMVENAGGRIEVHSQLGAGTSFFVHLPHPPAPAG